MVSSDSSCAMQNAPQPPQVRWQARHSDPALSGVARINENSCGSYSLKPYFTPEDVKKVTYNNIILVDPQTCVGGWSWKHKMSIYPTQMKIQHVQVTPSQGYVSRLKIAIESISKGGEGGKCKIIVWEPKEQFYIFHHPLHLHKWPLKTTSKPSSFS